MKTTDLQLFVKSCACEREPALVYGYPGVGKTSLIKAIAVETEYDCMILMPVIRQQEDYSGIFFCIEKNGKIIAEHVPITELKALSELEKPTIVVFDDLTTAKTGVMLTIMQLILERRIDHIQISDNAALMAICNPPEQCMGSPVPSPLKGRFISCVEMEVDTEQWLQLSKDNGVHYSILGYIKRYPHNLLDKDILNNRRVMSATASPRTWWKANKQIKMARKYGWNEHMLKEGISGAIGLGIGEEYWGYKERLEANMDHELVYKDPENAPIPKADDVMYAVIEAITYHLYIKEREEYKNRMKWGNVIKYAKRLNKADQFYLINNVLIEKRRILGEIKDEDRREKESKKLYWVENEEINKWRNGNAVSSIIGGV